MNGRRAVEVAGPTRAARGDSGRVRGSHRIDPREPRALQRAQGRLGPTPVNSPSGTAPPARTCHWRCRSGRSSYINPSIRSRRRALLTRVFPSHGDPRFVRVLQWTPIRWNTFDARWKRGHPWSAVLDTCGTRDSPRRPVTLKPGTALAAAPVPSCDFGRRWARLSEPLSGVTHYNDIRTRDGGRPTRSPAVRPMRIPPLRSAVQMGSDVSPGSSVTPGRRVSSDAHR
jgi:hypothetical protein